MLCQSDLILLHKWGLDDSQSHTTVGTVLRVGRINCWHCMLAKVLMGPVSWKLHRLYSAFPLVLSTTIDKYPANSYHNKQTLQP